nr:MAG TPA: hypothetical protein [Caudoviricetes sp.]
MSIFMEYLFFSSSYTYFNYFIVNITSTSITSEFKCYVFKCFFNFIR